MTMATAKDKYLAMMSLMNSDRNCYGKLIEELGNKYLNDFFSIPCGFGRNVHSDGHLEV